MDPGIKQLTPFVIRITVGNIEEEEERVYKECSPLEVCRGCAVLCALWCGVMLRR